MTTNQHDHMGLAEIAARLDVSRQRAHELRLLYSDFPEPANHLSMGAVWHAADVEAWIAAHPDRKPGRPKKEPTP